MKGRGIMGFTASWLLLVVLLSPSCHCDLKNKDLDVKDIEDGMTEPSSSTGSGFDIPVYHEDEQHRKAEPLESGPLGSPPSNMSERSIHPTQTGQQQKILTELQWSRCPGYEGHNCQQRASTGNTTEAENQSSQEQTEQTPTDVSGVDDLVGDELETALLENGDLDADNSVQQSSGDDVSPVPGHFGGEPAVLLSYMDSISLLSTNQIVAAIMTQLQPILENFNHTLKHLSSEIEGLSTDLQKLRHEQENISISKQDRSESELNESFVQTWAQLNLQQKQFEETVELQQKLFQNSWAYLKEDIDHHINQSHGEIQERLQFLSESIEEIQLDHKKMQETIQEEHDFMIDLNRNQSDLINNVWKSITSLEKKALNNSVKLSTLSEYKDFTNVTHNLEDKLKNSSQSSDIQSEEIGFELQSARIAGLKTVYELTANLSTQERRLKDIELDVDNIYQHLQKHESATAEENCDCKKFSDSLVTLELKVANVLDMAKENRYALEDAEAKRALDHWNTEVEDLHQGLLSVKETLAFEQANRRTINNHVTQLKTSLMDCQQEITGLKEQIVNKSVEIRRLAASFSSLLNDAIRHSEVLEVLLGDEVMEFSRWSDIQRNEMAIPVLQQRLQLMQQKIDKQESDLTSLSSNSPEKDLINNDDPATFKEWSLPKDQLRDSEDLLPSSSQNEDYSVSDFWSLGREVEELDDRLNRLEQQHCNCTANSEGSVMELQKEVASLRHDHEAHLRTFKNLFSYTDELVSSSGSVDLDMLWTISERRDRKRKKGQKHY